MNLLKKHSGLIVLSIVLISFDILLKQLFYTGFLLYGLLIRFFLSDSMNEKFRKVLKKAIWTSVLVILFLLYYSNHNFPRGPRIYTGDIICRNDDRGPCTETFIEDTRNLDIPEWVKFFKGSKGELLLFGLLFAGIAVGKEKGKDSNDH